MLIVHKLISMDQFRFRHLCRPSIIINIQLNSATIHLELLSQLVRVPILDDIVDSWGMNWSLLIEVQFILCRVFVRFIVNEARVWNVVSYFFIVVILIWEVLIILKACNLLVFWRLRVWCFSVYWNIRETTSYLPKLLSDLCFGCIVLVSGYHDVGAWD